MRRAAAAAALLRFVGACGPGAVPCQDGTAACCSIVWCGGNLTLGLDQQACGDQADSPAERAQPRSGAAGSHTCSCHNSTVQGEGYTCSGGRCVRVPAQCNSALTATYQVCGSHSWPKAGQCRCQEGYECVDGTGAAAGTRSCASTSCDWTIYACAQYRSQTRLPGAQCECSSCQAGYVLREGSLECLPVVACGDAAQVGNQCPGDAGVVDGACVCSAATYCAAAGAEKGRCVRKAGVRCGDAPDAVTQLCPGSAPLDPTTGVCACDGGRTCLANRTCGVVHVRCDAVSAEEEYKLCVPPTLKRGGRCACPEWGECAGTPGECVQARCIGGAIPRCGEYVSETPGADGCKCARCTGTGVGVILTDEHGHRALNRAGRHCTMQIGCGAVPPASVEWVVDALSRGGPVLGDTWACADHATPDESGACACDGEYVCGVDRACYMARAATPAPTPHVVIVPCDSRVPDDIASTDADVGTIHQCTPFADALDVNGDGVKQCKCISTNLCYHGVCGREAEICGTEVHGSFGYCRDIEAYADPDHHICTCTDHFTCFNAECVPNPSGSKLTLAKDRVSRVLGLTILGMNVYDFKTIDGRRKKELDVLEKSIFDEIYYVDSAHLSENYCKITSDTDNTAHLTQGEAREWAADSHACMQILKMCEVKYHGALYNRSYIDAEVLLDSGRCTNCNCWYPPIEDYGPPYSVPMTVAEVIDFERHHQDDIVAGNGGDGHRSRKARDLAQRTQLEEALEQIAHDPRVEQAAWIAPSFGGPATLRDVRNGMWQRDGPRRSRRARARVDVTESPISAGEIHIQDLLQVGTADRLSLGSSVAETLGAIRIELEIRTNIPTADGSTDGSQPYLVDVIAEKLIEHWCHRDKDGLCEGLVLPIDQEMADRLDVHMPTMKIVDSNVMLMPPYSESYEDVDEAELHAGELAYQNWRDSGGSSSQYLMGLPDAPMYRQFDGVSASAAPMPIMLFASLLSGFAVLAA